MISVYASKLAHSAAKSQKELAGQMDGSPYDQILVGQKCQDMTEEGKEETGGQRELHKETSFTESALKERKEGCRNPFSNVPFPSTKNKELSKVVLTRKCEQNYFLLTSNLVRIQKEKACG